MRKIPLWLKMGVTAWAGACVGVYAFGSVYGLLWFCNVGLVLTVVGLWTENRILISMPAVGNVGWMLLWCLDIVLKLAAMTGLISSPGGPAAYMFNGEYPLVNRILSLYHGWLPFVLIFALWRVGYDKRALWAQTLLVWLLILLAYLLVPDWQTPAGNVNLVFGYSVDEAPVLWFARPVWIGLLMAACPVVLYLPLHFVYGRVFTRARARAS